MIKKNKLAICLVLLLVTVGSASAILNSVFSDIDNDGDLDMFLEVMVKQEGGKLYRINKSDGIGVVPNVTRGAFVDVNADGREDLFISRRGMPDLLYRNLGNRKFSDITASAIGQFLTGNASDPVGSVFADLDMDGIPDAFVNQRLFLSNGISFAKLNSTNVTNASGLSGLPNVSFVAAPDMNKDNLTDLLFAAGNGSVLLFLNLNDTNNDGIVEFYDATFDSSLNLLNRVTFPALGNIQTGLAYNSTYPFHPFSTFSAPFVEDVFLDIYAVRNGSNELLLQVFPEPPAKLPFLNQSWFYIPEFINTTTNASDPGNGTAAILADFDNNGMTDIFVANSDNTSTGYLRYNSSWLALFSPAFNFSFLNNIKIIQAADWSGDGIMDFAGINDSFAIKGSLMTMGSLAFIGSNPGGIASVMSAWPSINFQQWSALNRWTNEFAISALDGVGFIIDGKGDLGIGAGAFAGNPVNINEEPQRRQVIRRTGGSPSPAPPKWCIRVVNCEPPKYEECWTSKSVRDEVSKSQFNLVEDRIYDSSFGKVRYVGSAEIKEDLQLIPFEKICVVEPPVISPPETPEVKEPEIEPPEEEVIEPAPEKKVEKLESPSCSFSVGLFSPLGIIPEDDYYGTFDFVEDGLGFVKSVVLVQNDHTRYAGSIADVSSLDFNYGDVVRFCRDDNVVYSSYLDYFFIPVLDKFVDLFAEPSKITVGKVKDQPVPSGSCAPGLIGAQGLKIGNKFVAKQGVFDFEDGIEFQKDTFACLPKSDFVWDFLAAPDILINSIFGKTAVASSSGCTPYGCSVLVPEPYDNDDVPVDLPENYGFVTMKFAIPDEPPCTAPVESTIVLPSGYNDFKIYAFDSGGFEEVEFDRVDGLVCGGSWSEAVHDSMLEDKSEEFSEESFSGNSLSLPSLEIEFSSAVDVQVQNSDYVPNNVDLVKIAGYDLLFSHAPEEISVKSKYDVFILSEGALVPLEGSASEFVEENKLTIVVADRKPVETGMKKVYDGGADVAVLLMHGIFSSSSTFEPVIEWLKFTNQPYQVWVFDYGSDEDFYAVSERLASDLEANTNQYDSISIVAHSLGGLIAQNALQEDRFNVRRIIFEGTPTLGSAVAPEQINVLNRMIGSLPWGELPTHSTMLSAAFEGKQFPKLDGVDYYSVAGTKSLAATKHFFDSLNDGLVSVKSATAVDAIRSFKFEVNHNSLPDHSDTIKTAFGIIEQDLPQDRPLVGSAKYVHLSNVPVEGKQFIIAAKGAAVKDLEPVNWCYMLGIIMYLVVGLFALSLFFFKKLTYPLLALIAVLTIAIILLCGKFPFIPLFLAALAYISRLLFRFKPDFDVGLLLAYGRLLEGKDIASNYRSLMRSYESLSEERKPDAYSDLIQFADFAKEPASPGLKERIAAVMENRIRRLYRRPLTSSVKEKLREKLGSLSALPPRIKSLIR